MTAQFTKERRSREGRGPIRVPLVRAGADLKKPTSASVLKRLVERQSLDLIAEGGLESWEHKRF
jgi:hypothetical protein